MKTKLYILSILISAALTVYAQSIPLPAQLPSANQQLIQKTVKDGLFILQTAYILQDSTGNQFGRQGKQYFNQITSFAFAIDNHIITHNNSLTPWLHDDQFQQYKLQYQPFLNQTLIKNITDSAFTDIDSTSIAQAKPIFNSYTALNYPNTQGFDTDTTKGYKDGWLCLLTQPDTTNFEIRCINYPINIDSLPSISANIQSIMPKTLGGVYLNPVISKPGNINFKLCGIIQPAPQGNSFNIDLPFFSSTKPNNNISTIKPNDPKIIPIQKNKQQPRKP
ncbi:MAG: hypothetical protein IJ834_05035 [Paludibacteraceae bacterium]|nr:hypothetical protein [Paludibacteraceae bacterium]